MMKEIVSLRTERNKTYDISDRKHRLVCHCKPIHYQLKGKTNWENINLEFREETDKFIADENKVSVGFRKDLQLYKYFGIRYDYEHQFEGTIKEIKIDNIEQIKTDKVSSLQRKTPIEIRHQLNSEIEIVNQINEVSLKNFVKVNSPIENFKIVEELHLKGLSCSNEKKGISYIPDEYGKFNFTDENKELKFWINEPFFIDNYEQHSQNIIHTLQEINGHLIYTKTPTKKGKEDLILAIYPILIDTNTYYSSTSDGRVSINDSSWATARGAETGDNAYSAETRSTGAMLGSYNVKLYDIVRSFFYFDTSDLGSGATVTGAVLKIYGYTNAESDVCAMKGTQADTLTTADYNNYTGLEYGHVTWGIGAYKSITFNPQGKTDVNKTGTTKICCREYTHDYSNATPTAIKRNGCYYAEYGGHWSIEAGVFNQAESVATKETEPWGIFFNSDGTKMYIVGKGGDDKVNEYSLSTGWDVSTATWVRSKLIYSTSPNPQGLYFKPDGTKMYVTSSSNVDEYSLSTGWDISTLSSVRTFSVSTQDFNPIGIFFKTDGSIMYVIGGDGNDVNQYALTTPWDISSASYTKQKGLSNPTGIWFKSDGTKMYTCSSGNDRAYEYDLSTAWDVATATETSDLAIADKETLALGIFVKSDGTKFYIIGNEADEINEYDMPSSTTQPKLEIDYTTGGASHTKDLSETLSVSESLRKETSLFESESIGLAESKATESAFKKSSLDSLSLVESFSNVSAYIKSLSDNLWLDRQGGSLSFDGDDDYVDCGNAVSLRITDNITLEAWINSDDFSASQCIMGKSAYNNDGYRAYVDSSRRLIWEIVNGAGVITLTSYLILPTSGWSHIVMTYDGINQKIYKNGKEFHAYIGNDYYGDLTYYGDAFSDENGMRAYPWGFEPLQGNMLHYFDGGGIARMVGDSSDDATLFAIPDLTYDKPIVIAGEYYTQSFEVKLNSVAGNGVRLIHQWFNSTEPATMPFQSDYGDWETGTADWHTISYNIQAPVGAIRGDIVIELWGSGTLRIKNPKFYLTTAAKRLLTISTQVFKIGETTDGYWNFNGKIDEARVYNRVLSLDEVKEHRDGIFNNESSLKGCWHMNEGLGNTAYDSSAESNDGELHGSTWIQEGALRIKNYIADMALSKTDSLSLTENFIKNFDLKKLESIGLAESKLSESAFKKSSLDSLSFSEIVSKQSAFKRTESDILSLIEAFSKQSSTSKKMSDTFSFGETKTWNFDKELSDSFVLAEILKTSVEKTFADTLSMSDVFARIITFEKSFIETELLVETFSKESGKSLTDSISFLETLRKELRLIASDIFSLNEILSREAGKKIIDSVSFVESLTKNIGLTKSETLALTETLSRILEAKRSFSDSFLLIEAIAPLTTFKKTLVETLAFTEILSKESGLNITDSLILVESSTKTAGSEYQGTETFALSETLSKKIDLSRTELLTLVESFSKVFQSYKSFDESLLLTENLKKENRLVKADSMTLTENLIKRMHLAKVDNISFSEIYKKQTDKNIFETFSLSEIKYLESKKEISDNLVLAESLIKNIGLTSTEAISFAETVSKVFEAKKSFSETLNLSDSVSILLDFKESLIETLTLAEVLAKKSGLFLLDSFVFIESILTTEGTSISKVETLSLAESLSKESKLSKLESLSLIESLSKTVQTKRTFSETLELVETLKNVVNLSKTDSLTLTEKLVKEIKIKQAENITFSEIYKKRFSKKLFESFNLDEIKYLKSEKKISDSLSLAESFVKNIGLTHSDSLVLSESVSRIFEAKKNFDESFALSDSISILLDFKEILVETVSLTEVLMKEAGLSLSDTLNIIENILTTEGTSISKIDTLFLVESLSKESSLSKTELLTIIETFTKVFSSHKNFTEDLLLTEKLKKEEKLVRTDSMVLTENLIKRMSFKKVDNIVFSESFLKQVDKELSESFTLDEIKYLESAKKISDNLVLAESLIKDIGLTESETIILSESISKIFEAEKTFSESLNFSDAVTILTSFKKNLIETLAFAEVLSKESGLSLSDTLNIVETILTTGGTSISKFDALSLAESLSKESKLSKAESLAIVESFSKIFLSYKNLTEVLNLVDSYKKSESLIKTDTFVLTENLIKELNISKADTIVFSDSYVKQIGKNLDDVLSITEVSTSEKVFQRIFTENLILAETLTELSDLSFSESLILSEVFSKIFEAEKSFSETLTILESYIKDLSIKKIDSFNLAETIKKEYKLVNLDSFLLSEVLKKTTDLYFIETLDLSEDKIKSLNLEKTEIIALTETIGLQIEELSLSDSFILTENLIHESQKSFVDILSLSETFQKTTGKSITESMTLVEILLKDIAIAKTESLSLIEVLKKEVKLKKTDNISLAENIKKTTGISLTESFSLIESLKKVLDLSQTDSLVLSESFQKEIEKQEIENLNLIESINTSVVYSKIFTETLALNEIITEAKRLLLVDLFSIAEIIKKSIKISKNETLVVSEEVIETVKTKKEISDQIILSEQLSTQKIFSINLVDDTSLIENLIKEVGLSLTESFELIELLNTSEKEPVGKKAFLLTKGNKTYLFSKKDM